MGKGDRRGRDGTEPIIIKKYANRRLYNTASSRYVTLEQLSEMVKSGEEFRVLDAKTDDDITRSVLTQIIFEEESKGQNLLPVNFLRQLIQMYGNALQPFVPSYLETAMETFLRNQETMREQITSAFGAVPPLKQIDELTKQNLALMERAMQSFSPFNWSAGQSEQSAAPEATTSSAAPDTSAPSTSAKDNQISELMERINAMQEQLDTLAKKTD